MILNGKRVLGGKSLRRWSLGFGALILLHAVATILYANVNLQQTYFLSSQETFYKNTNATFEYYQTIPLSQRLALLKESTPECKLWAHKRPKQVNAFCQKIKCDLHPPIDSFAMLREDPISPNVTTFVKEQKKNHSQQCKMLAFSGMHMGQGSVCPKTNTTTTTSGRQSRGGYRQLYAVNLLSMMKNAAQTLYPVIILSTLGIKDEVALASVDQYAEWLRGKGATVIVMEGLSFQDQIPPLNHGDLDHQVGPFIRLDLPDIIEQHKLFDMPNICSDYILYTDTDSMFVNPISMEDTLRLRARLELEPKRIVSYGRQQSTVPNINTGIPGGNTGVMIMHVPRFQKEWPDILAFAKSLPEFPAHDQFLLNWYFQQKRPEQFDMLPLHWNWKSYWRLEPSKWQDVKILHFHGPKPGRFLEETARCQIDVVFNRTRNPQYEYLSKRSICCDGARSMHAVERIYNDFALQTQPVCG